MLIKNVFRTNENLVGEKEKLSPGAMVRVLLRSAVFGIAFLSAACAASGIAEYAGAGGDVQTQPAHDPAPAQQQELPAENAQASLRARTRRALANLGYDVGVKGPLYERALDRAIKRAQLRLGVVETGDASAELLTRLKEIERIGEFPCPPTLSDADLSQPPPQSEHDRPYNLTFVLRGRHPVRYLAHLYDRLSVCAPQLLGEREVYLRGEENLFDAMIRVYELPKSEDRAAERIMSRVGGRLAADKEPGRAWLPEHVGVFIDDNIKHPEVLSTAEVGRTGEIVNAAKPPKRGDIRRLCNILGHPDRCADRKDVLTNYLLDENRTVYQYRLNIEHYAIRAIFAMNPQYSAIVEEDVKQYIISNNPELQHVPAHVPGSYGNSTGAPLQGAAGIASASTKPPCPESVEPGNPDHNPKLRAVLADCLNALESTGVRIEERRHIESENGDADIAIVDGQIFAHETTLAALLPNKTEALEYVETYTVAGNDILCIDDNRLDRDFLDTPPPARGEPDPGHSLFALGLLLRCKAGVWGAGLADIEDSAEVVDAGAGREELQYNIRTAAHFYNDNYRNILQDRNDSPPRHAYAIIGTYDSCGRDDIETQQQQAQLHNRDKDLRENFEDLIQVSPTLLPVILVAAPYRCDEDPQSESTQAQIEPPCPIYGKETNGWPTICAFYERNSAAIVIASTDATLKGVYNGHYKPEGFEDKFLAAPACGLISWDIDPDKVRRNSKASSFTGLRARGCASSFAAPFVAALVSRLRHLDEDRTRTGREDFQYSANIKAHLIATSSDPATDDARRMTYGVVHWGRAIETNPDDVTVWLREDKAEDVEKWMNDPDDDDSLKVWKRDMCEDMSWGQVKCAAPSLMLAGRSTDTGEVSMGGKSQDDSLVLCKHDWVAFRRRDRDDIFDGFYFPNQCRTGPEQEHAIRQYGDNGSDHLGNILQANDDQGQPCNADGEGDAPCLALCISADCDRAKLPIRLDLISHVIFNGWKVKKRVGRKYNTDRRSQLYYFVAYWEAQRGSD